MTAPSQNSAGATASTPAGVYGVAPAAPPAATILAEPNAPRPPPDPRQVQRSTALLALAALLFAGMALCAKRAATRLPGPEVAFLRFVIGVLSMVIPLASGQPLRPRNFWALFLRGLFGGAAVLLYFGAIAHLPVGLATLLNSSSPLFVALFSSVFLREPLGPRTGSALLITLIGVVLVVGGGVGVDTVAGAATRGDLLGWSLIGLASAVLSGAAVTTVRSMRQREGSWEIFLAFSLIGGAITGIPTLAQWVTPDLSDCVWLAAMGALSVAAQITLTHTLRDVPAITAMLILQLTPLSTFLLGALWLGERPAPLGWIGAAVTIAGVTWGMLPTAASRAAVAAQKRG